jgi:hypothetical protein
VSQKASRANLIDERPLHAAIEQLRYAVARTTPFPWIRARWQPRRVDDAMVNEDQRALLALVDAFERLLATAR